MKLGYCGLIQLTQHELDKLLEYSCSIPTDPKPGFRWKQDLDAYWDEQPWPTHVPHWWMGESVEIGSKTEVGIRWYDVIIVETI